MTPEGKLSLIAPVAIKLLHYFKFGSLSGKLLPDGWLFFYPTENKAPPPFSWDSFLKF